MGAIAACTFVPLRPLGRRLLGVPLGLGVLGRQNGSTVVVAGLLAPMAACLRPQPSQLIQVAQDPLDSAVPFVLLVLLLGRPFAGPLGRFLVRRGVLANLAFAQIGDGEPSLDFLRHAKEDFSLLFNRHLGFS